MKVTFRSDYDLKNRVGSEIDFNYFGITICKAGIVETGNGTITIEIPEDLSQDLLKRIEGIKNFPGCGFTFRDPES